MKSVAIVDYGMGNLRSVASALSRAGASPSRADTASAIERAERLVIPGQGAFGQASSRLGELGLMDPLRAVIAAGRPVLGICLGLQILYQVSEEALGAQGLGAVEGGVTLLPLAPGIKRPHMGWSPVEHASDHPVLSANPSGAAFYFVHSFAAAAAPSFAVAIAEHGVRFVAALARENLVATQFHPEKSQDAGARLIDAWLGL